MTQIQHVKMEGSVPVPYPRTPAEPTFPYRIVANEYGFYCLPRDYMGREVPRILSAGGVYEPDTLALMRRIVGDGDIVTGGAFIGDFFPALSQVLVPGARLHSFEPNPVSFAAAAKTVQLNDLQNVHLSPVAVGEVEATLPLLVRQGKQASAARAKLVQNPDQAGTIDVPVVLLDDLIPANRRVSVLQLDIEGFEIEAVRGAQRLIRTSRPAILLEGERPARRQAYADVLASLFPEIGYRPSGVIERNAIFLPRR